MLQIGCLCTSGAEEKFEFLKNELSKFNISLQKGGNPKATKYIMFSNAASNDKVHFYDVAKELYRRNVRPFILVHDVENEEAFPEQAAIDAAYAAQFVDQSVDWVLLDYITFFFNFQKRTVGETPEECLENEKENFELLAEAIREYVSEE